MTGIPPGIVITEAHLVGRNLRARRRVLWCTFLDHATLNLTVNQTLGSIECQKCGALHLHLMLFLQCMHQHSTLHEIAEKLRHAVKGASLLQDFCTFKAHVDREVYEAVEAFRAQRKVIEDAWPLYAEYAHLLIQPSVEAIPHLLQQDSESLREFVKEGERWKCEYLKVVQRTQQMRNHHIHLPNEDDPEGPRKPQGSCINKNHPGVCKSGFPKEKEASLLATPAVVCHGLADRLGLRSSGKKGMLGATVGPRNEPYLNGTHAGLMYALPCNSDTLLTYRLPVIPETHSELCEKEGCLTEDSINEGVIAALRAQRDSAGYVPDYISKRQPLAKRKIKAFLQGQHQLCADLNMENASTIRHARRSTQRVMNDLYGRGLTRMEMVNLNVYKKSHDVTAAESIKSALLVPFPCSQFIACQQAAVGQDVMQAVHQPLEIDARNPKRMRVVTDKNVGYKYGYRGMHPAVRHLSPYMFTSEWEIQRATYPTNTAARFDPKAVNDAAQLEETLHHAFLTEAGKAKMKDDAKAELQPGIDYQIHGEEGITKGRTWVAFPASASSLRHEFVMTRRLVPAVPKFQGMVLPKAGTQDDHARHMSVYLRPWCLDPAHADEHVPHVAELQPDGVSWHDAWISYCRGGVLSEPAKRFIINFQAVFALRQEDDLPVDGGIRGTAIVLTDNERSAALKTSMRQRRAEDGSRVDDESASASFKLVEEIWGGLESNKSEPAKHVKSSFKQPPAADVDSILKATQESQKQDSTRHTTYGAAGTGAVVMVSSSAIIGTVEAWRKRMKEEPKTKMNLDQCAFIDAVADRVLKEEKEQYTRSKSEPMRMLVTGGPGCGKSYVIKSMRSLFDALHWAQSQQYQFAAFQAVVADQIGGDTLHHSCGIAFGCTSRTMEQRMQQSRNMSMMRWLIIDEVSQVGAELLSQADTNIRSAVQAAGTYKYRGDGSERPWGGLNVLYVGDFLQLPPTKATPLCTLPNSLLNLAGIMNPRVQRGLDLFWNDTQRIITFEKQMRCDDEWWLEVLEECRHGRMTQDTWAYLHGTHTSTSGMWLNGTCKDGTVPGPQCAAGCLQQEGECAECEKERKRRCRVYKAGERLGLGADDRRLQSKKFRHAVTVVPNNDLKMEICKRGAAQWARDHGERILWCAASDRVTSKCGLLEDEHLRSKKVAWLSKHDKACGGLFGMLPLIRGMPVYLTNHIDRSEKGLLRGKSGTLVGWQLDPREPTPPKGVDHFLTHLPKCVYVQFQEEVDGKEVTPGWSMAHLENGVYAIAPKPEYWYLDASATYSHMKIRRHQLPIAPNFGRTAYSMQGFTLPAGNIDLNLSINMDAVTAYVAMSRFRTADDVLILQPFNLKVFQQGVPDQAAMLLTYIGLQNKDEIEAMITEHKARVAEHAANEAAAKRQKKADVMKANRKPAVAKQYRCSHCGVQKGRGDFTDWQRKKKGWCKACQKAESQC